MRALPNGLSVCADCGEIRGRTRYGNVSACLCQGVVCNRCGARSRRPISEYYDPRDRSWWHVPYFQLMAHRCPAPAERRVGEKWTQLPVDDDVKAHQEATTRQTWAEVEARAAPRTGVEAAAADRACAEAGGAESVGAHRAGTDTPAVEGPTLRLGSIRMLVIPRWWQERRRSWRPGE